MKNIILIGCVCIFILSAISCAEKEEWIALFNEENLDGWHVKIKGYDLDDNFGNTFRVKDKTIQVSYDQYDGQFKQRFGHLFYKQPYSDYKLKLKYRFVGAQIADGPGWAFRNSGIMIHGQNPTTMEKNQDFPTSIEVQLLGGNGKDERSTGNICSPGTHIVMKDALEKRHCINSHSKTYHGDDWVNIELEVYGDSVIHHIIEGDTVLTYQQPQLDTSDAYFETVFKHNNQSVRLEGGTISLQSESHEVHFKDIYLLPLKRP